MLTFLREHATSWLIKIALFAIVVVFIFWGGYSYQARKASRLARVGDHYITYAEYNQAYDRLLQSYRDQLGDHFSEDLIEKLNIKQQALDMLIDRYVILKAAMDLGLVATAREVQQQILSFPAFQDNGHFDKRRYIFILRQNNLTPEEFEAQVKESLTISKVKKFVQSQVLVTSKEVDSYLNLLLSRIRVAFVSFDAEDFVKGIEVDESKLEKFYKRNLSRYMEPERRKVAWVEFRTTDYLSQVVVKDEDIASYYEEHKERFQKEGKSLEEAREEITAVLRQEHASEMAFDHAGGFADLALAQGDLAKAAKIAKLKLHAPAVWFSREDRLPAIGESPEVMEALFHLAPNEISEVLEFSNGYLVAQVLDIRPQEPSPFPKVKERVREDMVVDLARHAAEESARKLLKDAVKLGDLAKAASLQNLTVKESEWFSRQNPPKDSLLSRVPRDALFSLTPGHCFPKNPLRVGDTFIVYQLLARKAPDTATLEENRTQVRSSIVQLKKAILWNSWLKERREKSHVEILRRM